MKKFNHLRVWTFSDAVDEGEPIRLRRKARSCAEPALLMLIDFANEQDLPIPDLWVATRDSGKIDISVADELVAWATQLDDQRVERWVPATELFRDTLYVMRNPSGAPEVRTRVIRNLLELDRIWENHRYRTSEQRGGINRGKIFSAERDQAIQVALELNADKPGARRAGFAREIQKVLVQEGLQEVKLPTIKKWPRDEHLPTYADPRPGRPPVK